MAFELAYFASRFPWLYHTTQLSNFTGIHQSRTLISAQTALARVDRGAEARSRRSASVQLSSIGVTLCDNSTLHEKNIHFYGGWTLGDLLAAINRRVFFWPGDADSVHRYGQSHYGRYNSEGDVAVIRVPTAAAFSAATPEFCEYNSGSPRYSRRFPAPRGPDLFETAERCTFLIEDVKEVTFRDTFLLPAGSEHSQSLAGPWSPL